MAAPPARARGMVPDIHKYRNPLLCDKFLALGEEYFIDAGGRHWRERWDPRPSELLNAHGCKAQEFIQLLLLVCRTIPI